MSSILHCARGCRRFAAGAISLCLLLPLQQAGAAEVILDGLSSERTHQRFIIRYREDGSSPRDRLLLHTRLAKAAAALPARSGRAVTAKPLRHLAAGAELVQVDVPLDRRDAETLMRRLAAEPDIASVEVDRRFTIAATPNDPRFADQWAYTGTYGIRAAQAWDQATGAGVVVAVLDTGIAAHSDLDTNVLPGYDFITDLAMANDGDGRDADARDPGDWVEANQCGGSHAPEASSWHGTHVAGTVAAVSNNGRGVAGTAPAARILPVRVLGTCGGYMSDIADALVWAAGGSVAGVPDNAHPAEVINLSLGGKGTCSSLLQGAIDTAVARGATIVVAAGNSNANASNASPANCQQVIAVGANDSAGKRSIWSAVQQSNYGAVVDLAAPGSDILSTLNTGSKGPSAESYAYYGGTSMAAPHVAGVVAMVQEVSEPTRTPAQVEALLKATVTPFPKEPDRAIGAGIVNAQAAVDAAINGTLPPAPEPEPDTELLNGVVLGGVAGAKGSNRYYHLQVPEGASNLLISIAGGSGDADLYVRADARPTASAYDCRPFRGGNGESCSIPKPRATRYHVMLSGYKTYAGINLKASWSNQPSQIYANGQRIDIADYATVESTINVAARDGNAPDATPVSVDIAHPWRGDLKLELLTPSGRAHLLSNYEGGSADDIRQTYEVDLSAEQLQGDWTLRIHDKASGDTGWLNGWTITF